MSGAACSLVASGRKPSVHQTLKEKGLALRGCLPLCSGKPSLEREGGGGRLRSWWGASEGSPKAVTIWLIKTHVPRSKDSRRDTEILKERRDGVKTRTAASGSPARGE